MTHRFELHFRPTHDLKRHWRRMAGAYYEQPGWGFGIRWNKWVGDDHIILQFGTWRCMFARDYWLDATRKERNNGTHVS